jgi:hypothetical protein
MSDSVVMALKEKDYGYIFDKDNSRSLVNITPTVISNYIKCIPVEYLETDLDKLEEGVRPTRTDRAVKVLFWREYNRAQLTNTAMHTAGLWRGVCQEMHLYKQILCNTKKLAWILSQSIEDELQLHLLYDKGLKRVEEILDFAIKKPDGKIDVKCAELVLKAYAMIENRVKGMATQRIEKKSLSLKLEEAITDENREEKIKLLKEKLTKFSEQGQ